MKNIAQFAQRSKIVLLNNSSLAFVELEMKAAGILDFATELHNPNFAEAVEPA